MKDLIRKWVLQNALKYEGKASAGAIIGKLISEDPAIKEKLKEVSKLVQQTIKEVNALSLDAQRAEIEKKWPELLEEKPKAEEKTLKPLPDAEEGRVVMRIAPSPSGPLHIGHAYVTGLNAAYCKKYGGKFILRIEDTNPENIYSPAYELIEQDVKWLSQNSVAEVIVQSKRLHVYYDYAEKLINKGHAYVCTCNADVFRETIAQKKSCPCRNAPVREQVLRWDNMFSSYEPGQAVVRIKTDVSHPNPAMRDWPAMRINCAKHPITGTEERVWPLMNFSVAIDDHELGVTHTLRGKDHMDNAKRQQYIFDYFGWKAPIHKFLGIITFEGFDLSKTKTKLAIERGEYEGWDDIRLPFLGALKRRGYIPEAFTKWAIDIGLTETDKTVSIEEFFKTLNHFNKEIVDPVANRYFFVWGPVKITVEGAPEREVCIDFHPTNKAVGERHLKTHQEFYITKEDADKLREGELYRLMDCLNFTKKGKKFVFVSQPHADFKERGSMIMHWLPVQKELVSVRVRMTDNKMKEGLGEPSVASIKEGTMVQLERFGFCRLDTVKNDTYEFWFGYR